MELSMKPKDGQRQLDVIATSRSGRLRKKSSKLADFESTEEMDCKTNSKKISPDKNIRSPSKLKLDDDLDGDLSDFDDIDIKEEDDWDLPDDDSTFLKLTDEDFREDQDLDGLQLPAHDLDFDMDDDFDVDDDGVEEDGKDGAGGMAHSLYFSEKQGGIKKSQLKDGQQSPRKKAQRKDKGKSRFTAYMLWAREVRPDITEKYPEMDFSSVNKKLGELWQLVPTKQRYNWKRRAKRLAVRLRQGGMIRTGRSKAGVATATPAAVVPGTGNGKPNTQTAHANGKTGGGGRTNARRGSPTKGARGPASPHRGATQQHNRSSRGSGSRGGNTGAGGGSGPTSPTGFKVTGTAAIDVAAHMKLLGESLNNIGHKLREHEGQIAVSGSLSVLLDSMLCVLGPLMCLTDQIEEVKGSIDPQTHAAILDNIAYIMPGIV